MGGSQDMDSIWPVNHKLKVEQEDPRKYWNAERYALLKKTHNLK